MKNDKSIEHDLTVLNNKKTWLKVYMST